MRTNILMVYIFLVVLIIFDVIASTNCFILNDFYNVEDKIHSNREKSNKNEKSGLNISKNKMLYYNLNKLASQEYSKIINTKTKAKVWFKEIEQESKGTQSRDYKDIVTPRLLRATKHIIHKRNLVKEKEKQYNYDYLIEEYYAEAVDESSSNKSYHASKKESSESGMMYVIKKLLFPDIKIRNFTNEEMKNIGFRAINCLIHDYKTGKQPTPILLKTFFRILKIWFLVYLAVALPLWCTRGWCFCCLFCKIFKPYQTIEEAKRYMVLNPPGVYKHHSHDEIHYEATDKERETYEEFEHLLRTL